MKAWLVSVGIVGVAAGCSWFANSHPTVSPGSVCWVFPDLGKVCVESERQLQALKLKLQPDAGAP